MTRPASPMLEKLARAIAGHFGPEFDNLPKDRKEAREWRRDPTLAPGAENTQQVMLDAADAALQALKDLDEGTVEAQVRAFGALKGTGAAHEDKVRAAFTAAIDHILKGGE